MAPQRLEMIAPYVGMQNDFDVLCVDTEFSDLPFPKEAILDWQRRIEVLALGICALDSSIEPSTFYAAREVNKKITDKCSAFVKANVIPYLDICEVSVKFRKLTDIRQEIAELVDVRSKLSGRSIAVASDWPGDLVLLSELFPPATTYVAVGGISKIQEAMFESIGNDLVRHNALHDCSVFRRAFLQHLGCN